MPGDSNRRMGPEGMKRDRCDTVMCATDLSSDQCEIEVARQPGVVITYLWCLKSTLGAFTELPMLL